MEKKIFSTIEEIEHFLDTVSQFQNKTGVERCSRLLEKIGHPEKDLKVVHVAGTNGKGSTCAYLDSLFQIHGFHTGLFTSPHLVDIRERIRIDGIMIEQEDFIRYFNLVYDAGKQLEQEDIQLAYFDYFFGVAMCIYQAKAVDIVILETGLGGKLDSTNAVPHPIACVITTLSLEHTAILGDTIEKIAAEKAGIIKEQRPVIVSSKNEKVMSVIRKRAQECNAECIEVTPDSYKIQKNIGNRIDFLLQNEYYKNDCFQLATSAVYQVENCSVALTAFAVVMHRLHKIYQQDLIRDAIYKMYWPGRMEQIEPDVYVDGAHNPEGMAAFLESAKQLCKGKSSILLFSVVRDKNFEKMIQMICEANIFSEYVITQVGGKRKLEEQSMYAVFCKYTDKKITEYNTVAEAYAYGRQKQDMMLCSGSLYLAGEIKSLAYRQEADAEMENSNDRF